jgi:hypothetical protein
LVFDAPRRFCRTWRSFSHSVLRTRSFRG